MFLVVLFFSPAGSIFVSGKNVQIKLVGADVADVKRHRAALSPRHSTSDLGRRRRRANGFDADDLPYVYEFNNL